MVGKGGIKAVVKREILGLEIGREQGIRDSDKSSDLPDRPSKRNPKPSSNLFLQIVCHASNRLYKK